MRQLNSQRPSCSVYYLVLSLSLALERWEVVPEAGGVEFEGDAQLAVLLFELSQRTLPFRAGFTTCWPRKQPFFLIE